MASKAQVTKRKRARKKDKVQKKRVRKTSAKFRKAEREGALPIR